MSCYSLYIHWPYCLSKCPYCDFASTKIHGDVNRLKAGYQRDINQAPAGKLKTIYFGGGTPSLMPLDFMVFLFNEIHKKWTLTPDCEITLEANPDAIDKNKMNTFYQMGINRLSVGVQSLNNQHLKFLGRTHDAQTALNCIRQAQEIFPRINMDLMYGLPRQSKKGWEKELNQALSLNLTHYSLYQLTIEEGTVFYKNQQQTCSELHARQLYKLTDEIMNNADIPAYEVSNYAKLGFESRHNMTYWMGGDYIGIGPAAAGRVMGYATQNDRSVGGWLNGKNTSEKLTDEQIQMERLLMGLRLCRHFYPTKNLSPESIKMALKKGWIIQKPQGIQATLKGILMLNRLIALLA